MINTDSSTKPKTRDLIKTEFLKLYNDKPLSKITVSDIIRDCNISRGTFYFHFEDTHALYRECERDMIDFMEGGLHEIILSTVRKDTKKHLDALCDYMKNTYLGHINTFKSFLSGSENDSFRQAWFDSIKHDFARAIEFAAGEMPEAKRENLASFYAGGYVAVIGKWILEDCSEPVEEVADLQVRIVFQGIISQK